MAVHFLRHLPGTALRCGILGASLCAAAAVHADNLLDIYSLALQNDPIYKQAIAQHQANLEARPQSRALLLPSFSATANTTANDLNVKYSGINLGGGGSGGAFTSGQRAYNSHGYSFDITQPLYHQSYIDQYKQAGKQVKESFAQLNGAEQSLILRVAQAYFNVLAAEDTLQLAKAEEKADEQQLEQTRQQFKVGLIAITDVDEAQASYDLAVAQTISATNGLANVREALTQITGQHHPDLMPLGANIPLSIPMPEGIDAWTDLALDRSPELAASRFATEVAQEQIAVQRSSHYPTLDLVFNSSNQVQTGSTFGNFSSSTNGSTIGLQVNVPIFQGGAIASRTRQAHDQFIAAQQAQEQQRRTTIDQTHQAYLGVQSNISLIKAYKQAIVSNTSSLEATKAGLEVGTRTTVDVLTARANLFTARTNYAKARYNYIITRLQLKQAAGTLAPEDLKTVNGWLQPGGSTDGDTGD